STGTSKLTLTTAAITYLNANNPTGATISTTTLDLGGQTGVLTIGDSTSTATELTISAVIPNGGINKLGAGTAALTGQTTSTGNRTSSAGALQAGSAENPGVSGPFGNQPASAAGTLLMNGGILQYSAANTIEYMGRFSTTTVQAFNFDTNGQTVTFDVPL